MTELAIRPLAENEEHLFESLPDPGLVGTAAFGGSYRDLAARGEYLPHQTWVALRGREVVARAAWRAGAGTDAPHALDWFDFTDFDAGVRLLRDAPLRAQYHLTLPPGWRDCPSTAGAATARIEAATAAGLKVLVERNGYRWTPEHGLPPRTGRLSYRAEPDDAVVVDAFRRIHRGTLDAHTRHTTAERGADAAARKDFDILCRMPHAREWLRLAYDADGDLVGLAATCRFREPMVGYIGVVPEHRGRGHSHDLLVEATHLLVERGAESIVAHTDTTNRPMAATFARVGYPVAYLSIHLV